MLLDRVVVGVKKVIGMVCDVDVFKIMFGVIFDSFWRVVFGRKVCWGCGFGVKSVCD